ncbi:MAG: lysophospholipid acyltransferase family protein, partial [Pseudomonadota bacterium]
MEIIIRSAKGAGMFAMFVLFGSGILFTLVCILPPVWTLNRVFGYKPSRYQKIQRGLFGVWLWLMGALGLLRSAPSSGRPCSGPAVVVGNHPGLFDVLFLIRDIPDLTVLVKNVLARRLPIGPLLRAAGFVLSPDMVHVSPLESLGKAMENLRAGYKFQLFPEGTRSPRGGLRPFNAGAFKMASRIKVPLQPVIIRNDPPFLPKGAKWFYPPR